jgi:glucan biosynthesis protein C
MRYSALNMWRAILLILGVFVHAGEPYISYDSTHTFRTINLISHHFRMEAFFTISGFLAWKSYQKKGDVFVNHRVSQLSLPLLTTYFVILPIGVHFAELQGRHILPGDLRHLWFLIDLIICVIVTDEISRRTGVIGRLNHYLFRNPMWLFISLVSIAGFLNGLSEMLNRIISSDTLVVQGHGFLSAVTRAPYFVVFYIAGFVIAQSADRFISFKIGQRWIIGPAALLLMVIVNYTYPVLFFGENRSFVLKIAAAFIVPAVALPMSLLILKAGTTFKADSRIFSVLADSAFTIYLWHYPLVLVFASLLASSNVGYVFKFFAVAAGALFVPLLIHVLLIRKSRYAALLFNGVSLTSRSHIPLKAEFS